MEILEKGVIEYESVVEFLMAIKKEFGGRDEKLMKVVELKKLKLGGRIIEKFVQEFKRAAQRSRYEGMLLIEEFKKRINSGIRRKLMEAERPPMNIR